MTVTESSQCDQDMQMGAQSDSLGYVPVSASSASYSVSAHPGCQRDTINPQILVEDYSGQFNFTEADVTSPSLLVQGILPSGNMDTENLYTSMWGQFRGYYADGTYLD